ncbi:thioesterase family protein [Sporosarcina sp. P1]|uniref:acyl-CoA thioesterase n=1 Tax=Sporosarcina sp. P1 TaxID=2048257 RepID=UPI000C168F53|nr:acyl-CoA thioesterase [Sporosarcina sp. P1]PIC83011.1 thioesterase [Sporosarcina sp. P1]
MSTDYIKPNMTEWLEQFCYETSTKVRVCETDLYAHVNNTSYGLYFEQGRADYLEALGFYEENLMFVVGDIYCRYHSEAYVREELVIKVRTARFGTKSFTIESAIQRKTTGDVIATGWATLIVMDSKTKTSMPIPQWAKQRIIDNERTLQTSI